MFRITIDGKRWNTSSGQRVKPSHWNKDLKSTNNDLVNKRLAQRENEIIQIASNLRVQGKLNLHELKKYFAPIPQKKQRTIVSFLNDFREKKILNGVGSSSASVHNKTVKFIEANKIVTIEQIDTHLIEFFLKNLKAKSGIVRRKYFNYWNSALKLAFKNGHIPYNPFDKIERPVFKTKSKQVVLNKDEINRIKNLDFSHDKHLDLIKDLFLFQSYTGLAYCDLMKTNIDHYKNIRKLDLLIGQRGKTSATYTTVLNRKAKAILKKYNFQFPKIQNKFYNKGLLIIDQMAQINKNITSHAARRSFGQISLDKGISLEAVSHMLGHKSIKTTQDYYARAGTNLVINELRLLKIV